MRRHALYELLQLILTSSISFHIIIIDFVLTLLAFIKEHYNYLMFVSCKFFKRILLDSKKNIFFIIQWKYDLLNRFDIKDWNLSKIIISNRDKKFLSKMWIVMFIKLDVKLLYFTIYHSQIDDQSERINQTMKIAFRFLISIMSYSNQWLKVLLRLQRDFNNFVHSIEHSFNEIAYDFISMQVINLQKTFTISMKAMRFSIKTKNNVIETSLILKNRRLIVRQEISNVIVFEQMKTKHWYDFKHQFLTMRANNKILIRLYREYDISFIIVIEKKFEQQYVDSIIILEKIERLTYRLNLSSH